MANFIYIKKDGSQGTITAIDSNAALKALPADADPKSGVLASQSAQVPTVSPVPSVPGSPTQPGGTPQGTPTPSKPDLVGFADAISTATNLARTKRNALLLGVMAPSSGVAPASDFNSILANVNRASTTFTQDLVTPVIDEFKQKNQALEKIRDLAINLGENGVNPTVISSILAENDPDKALLMGIGALQASLPKEEIKQVGSNLVAVDRKTGDVRVVFSGTETNTPTTEEQDAIDSWARRINSGTDKISSVPSNIRNKVVSRTKELAQEDLVEDVFAGFEQGIKEEGLISQLQTAYPEFSKAEIQQFVKENKPVETPQEEEKGGGLFGVVESFFSNLFKN